MKVKIIRHAKVDMPWRKRYSSREYDQAWAEYDRRDILPVKERIPLWPGAKIYVTAFKRTQQTAEQYLGSKEYTILDRLMDEVPLKAFITTKKKHRKGFYDIIGRLEWYLPFNRQDEHRRATMRRCNELISYLEKEGQDCILVLHGFYMHALLRAFNKRGYKLDKKKVVIRNLCTVVATKSA